MKTTIEEEKSGLSEKYQALIELEMRTLASYPRLFRMSISGQLQSLWPLAYPKVFSVKIYNNYPNVDIKMVFGDQVIWTRWNSVSPRVTFADNTSAPIREVKDRVKNMIISQ